MAQRLAATSSTDPAAGPARRSVVMLTPDEGHLDRRIAQEAATLAGHGWVVDIYAAVDPTLAFEGELAPGVRLLTGDRPRQRAGRGKRLARRFKHALQALVPPAARLVETIQYRRRDIAAEITAANEARLLRLGPYDLVVAHDVPVMPLAARLAAAWRAALVSDLHEVFPEQDEYFTSAAARRYWRALEGRGLAASDGILSVNPAIADYVRSTHRPAAPIAVVHNTVPLVDPAGLAGPTTIRTIYPIPDAARVLLFAGSLRRHKGLEILIDGVAEANLDGWVLAVLGSGPLEAALRRRIAQRGLTERVFLGRRATERELVEVASSADVALLPYQEVGFNYRIATPNKLFEYIQARLPIATSRLPEIERIVGPLGTAGFVDFSTARSTGHGLRAFISDVLPAITPAALEAAATRWAWEREEPALLDLVERATRRGAAS